MPNGDSTPRMTPDQFEKFVALIVAACKAEVAGFAGTIEAQARTLNRFEELKEVARRALVGKD